MASETSIEADALTNGSIQGDQATPTHEKGPRPPNRKKYEENLAELAGKIKEIEDTRLKASDKLRAMRELVSALRDRREKVSADKADLDEKLTLVTKAFEAKKEAMQKHKSNFVVSSEEALDQQIKLLQQELQKNHFKPTEERKLVHDIDKLNRSKKAIKEFKCVKDDMDKLKSNQKELREKRDLLYKERGELKRKEEDAKNEIRELRDSLEQMKVQIDTLSSERRAVMGEFRLQEMAHKKFISERREEAKLKRKEEKEAFEAQKMKEWEEIKANEEPFERERSLVATLIIYCKNLDPNLNEDISDDIGEENSKRSANSGENGGAPENCTVYRKNEENDFFFAGVSKKSCGGKKSAKKQKARNLKHNPEAYLQFASLSLKPPSTSKDIPIILEELKNKKVYYEGLAEKEETARQMKESSSSAFVDFLDDKIDCPPQRSDDKSKANKSKANSKKSASNFFIMEQRKEGQNEAFTPDQFPSLPQPASKNGPFFATAAASNSSNNHSRGWEVKATL